MFALIRNELYRMATIRSSWVTIALFATVAASFGVLNAYWWALFAGIGTFGIAVFTVAQHYQHRTVILLYLGWPKRLPVLLAQVVTTVLVAYAFTAVTGLTALARHGDTRMYGRTLAVIPIMAVFGAALAAIVRRASWLLYGFAIWFVVVEALAGQMRWPLPISSYLDAARGVFFGTFFFLGWAVAALAVAVLTLRRDVTTD
jgi:hypothetical protein